MSETVMMLSTCNADMTDELGNKWRSRGLVRAAQWDPDNAAKTGLRGLPQGVGNGVKVSAGAESKWIVWEALADDLLYLDGCATAPYGEVVFCGGPNGALLHLMIHGCNGPMVYLRRTGGHGQDVGVGDFGVAVTGARGRATAGLVGRAVAGHGGHAEAGESGSSEAGCEGVAVVGKYGAATVGWGGVARAGEFGFAHAYEGGMAQSGNGGMVVVHWMDKDHGRMRLAVGYVGEDGIEPDVAYRCDEQGRLVRVESEVGHD